MNDREFIKNYWQYYIELEKQVMATQRFVAFETRNNATYSMEYIELLQVICSEIDVVGKAIAQQHNPAFVVDSKTNINKWGYEVQNAFADLNKVNVLFLSEYELTPWKKWIYILGSKGYPVLDKVAKAETPFWWNAYNEVKHHRTSIGKGKRPNYTRANLKAVSNALAGLYVLEWLAISNYFASSITDIEKSRVFRLI